ncbi:N-acetylmuramoyl-L-alanine amidase [Candidatus Dojkabacteria bacterium]|nr:N-acetylmuramoyl-L-alanine amidase [Candidatus Dojkabacteria bacterium]
MARVIISAGHTSVDPGAVSGNLKEYELTRKIANAIIPYLRSHGLITLSVPPELDLARRIEWINSTGYRETLNDIAIEIHINDGGKSGIEGWFKEEGGNKSEDLAKKILEESSRLTGLQNQGVSSEYHHELGTLAFVHNCNPVSVLLECLYIDNEEDRVFLKDDKKIDLLGKGIAKGILKYLNIEFREMKNTGEIPAQKINQTSKVTPDNQTDNKKDKVSQAANEHILLNQRTSPPPAQTQQPNLPPRPSFQPSSIPPVTYPSPLTGGSIGGLSRGFDRPVGGAGLFNETGGNGESTYGGSNITQSRDSRKKTIEETYMKVLGREPNQNDLNYFLNIGITEDQLIKRMVDSQEHMDLVKARKEVIETKKKYEELSSKFMEIDTKAKDQEGIIKSLNTLLAQKNQALSDINNKMRQAEAKKPKSLRNDDQSSLSGKIDPYLSYKPSFTDRVFKFFSDIFE